MADPTAAVTQAYVDLGAAIDALKAADAATIDGLKKQVADLQAELAALQPGTVWGVSVPYDGWVKSKTGLTNYRAAEGVHVYPLGQSITSASKGLKQMTEIPANYPGMKTVAIGCLAVAANPTQAQCDAYISAVQAEAVKQGVTRLLFLGESEPDRSDRAYSGTANKVSATAAQANADLYCTVMLRLMDSIGRLGVAPVRWEFWANLTGYQPEIRWIRYAKVMLDRRCTGVTTDLYWTSDVDATDSQFEAHYSTIPARWAADWAQTNGKKLGWMEWGVAGAPMLYQATMLSHALDLAAELRIDHSFYNPSYGNNFFTYTKANGGATVMCEVGLDAKSGPIYKAKAL